MKRKIIGIKYLVLAVLLFCAFNSKAQVEVNSRDSRKMIWDKKGEIDISPLFDATTYFIVPDSFSDNEFDELEKELTAVWTLNKIKFVRDKWISKKRFIAGKTAFISLGGYVTETQMGRTENAVIYLKYSIDIEGYGNYVVGRVYLYPSSMAVVAQAKRLGAADTDDYIEICNKSENINNWSVGSLKNSFIFLQNKVKAKEEWSAVKTFKKKDEYKKLLTAGIHIPDYVLQNNSKFKLGQLFEEESLFKKFEIPYSLVSRETLNNSILNATEDYYYLNVVCNRMQTDFTVFNAKTNEIVYQRDFGGHSVRNRHLLKMQSDLKK